MKKLFTMIAAVCFAGSMMAAALVDGYAKVTDISTLAAGDKVVIYCDGISKGVTGWNGSKDATVAATGWVEYLVETATGGVYLKDEGKNTYIASPGSSNLFKYGTKAVCSVDANGVLKCNNRYLCCNDNGGPYYRMYTSVGSYKGFFVYKVLAEGVLSAPSITGDDYFIESTTVTIAAAEGAKIYYTLDGTEPTNASTEYTAPFELTANTTVKAIAYEGETVSPVSVAEFKKMQVLTCAEAAAACTTTESADKYVVRGYVTALIDGGYSSQYKNATFWVADEADGGNVLQAFRLSPVATADEAVKVGDYVQLIGKLKKYNSTPELVSGTYNIIPAPAPAATVVTIDNATVAEEGQNLNINGVWGERDVTISLWQGGTTKGFGTYSGAGEGDYYGYVMNPFVQLFPAGDGVYADNGNGTFTFKAMMTDGDAQYDVTMNGAIPVAHTYTVAGSSDALFGTAWDPSNTDNNMMLVEDIYIFEQYNVTLLAGNIEFKVCEDYAWTVSYPASNYSLAIPADGIYTISITFNPATKEVNAMATKTGDAVIIPTIAMHGNFTGTWGDTENFTLAADNKTATLVLNMEATTDKPYEFGMRIGGKGDWTSNGVAFTRENASAEVVKGSGNLTLAADVEGDYTFTWTFETNTLAITFPTVAPEPAAWDEIVFTEVAAKGSLNGAVFKAPTNAAFTLTVTDTDASKLEVDENTASFGTAEENGTYTFRLKTGGKSSAKNGLTLAIPADGKLRIAARTGSNSATDRTIVLKQGDVELYNKVVLEADKVGDYYPYILVDVKQGTVNVEYPINTINFYAFAFKAAAGPSTGFENIEATEKAVKFIENGQVYILRDGNVYNVMGVRVK